MMQFALRVDYVDGSGVDVTATTPDLIAFERQFDKPFTVFADNLRLEYLLWLSWHNLKRKGVIEVEFDPWCETVDGVRIGETVEPVPLENSLPTGS